MGGRKLLPIDPRPSRADPEARRLRKEMEKEHNYEWVPPIVLGLIGITLAWDVTKEVTKCEERIKQQEEQGQEKEEGHNNNKKNKNGNEEGDDQGEGRRRRREKDSNGRRSSRRRKHDSYDDDEEEGRRERREDVEGDNYEGRRRGFRGRQTTTTTDYDLDRADRLERGEGGGVGDGWDRGRDRGEGGDEYRKRRSLAYDGYADRGRSRRGRDDADYDYVYENDRRGRIYDDRKSRPRPRRRSSDW